MAGNANDVLSSQMAETSAFGKLMNSRFTEYAELATTFSERTRKAGEEASASARKVVDEASATLSQNAREAVDERATSKKKA